MYDTKERSDKRKEEIKKKIKQEIPLLNQRVEEVDLKIMNSKFLDIDPEKIEENVEEMLEELERVQKEFDDISDKKEKVQIY
jgi:hypothetical protein